MEPDLHQITDNIKIIDYIFAGEALITVRNEDTKNRFTFKIQRRKNPHKIKIDLWWVSVLTMPNNGDKGSYKFIGALSREKGFKHSDKSYIKNTSQSIEVAYYYFNRLLGFGQFPLHSNIRTYHNGYCGRCGRLLTVPESIATGYGEECSRLMNVPYEVPKGQSQYTIFDQPNSGIADYQIQHSNNFV